MESSDLKYKYYDCLIYKDKQIRGVLPPRRINVGEYQIEWHRKGIQFLRCPEGWLCHQENSNNRIPIASGIIVPWNVLPNETKYDITTLSGEKQYVIRIQFRGDFKLWLERCIKMDHNVNKEMLWYIAEYYESKWKLTTSSQEIKMIYGELKSFSEKLKDLNTKVDDGILDLLLKTWQQRLEEQLIKDVFSDDEKTVMESIAYIRNGNAILSSN